MTEERTNNNGISRRDFMKGATAGAALMAGGALLSGTPLPARLRGEASGAPLSPAPVGEQAASSQPVGVPTTWAQTADVVVVGYGGAGAATAISAFDAGANVLILEKTPSLASLGVTGTTPAYTISGGGGNTHMSGGICVWPNDPVLGAEYMYSTSWGETPYDVCQAWGTMANQNKAWFDKMGIPYTINTSVSAGAGGAYPNLPGASCVILLSTTGSGAVFFHVLDAAVQSRGIPVLFNTPATSLIQNPTTKEILGVQALSNYSEVLNIRANRGVVLCCGGFENNDALLASCLKTYPAHPLGWQYNDGDGFNMALKVGAGIWHTNGCVATAGFWTPQYASVFSTSVKNNAYIFVDKYGSRFVNESEKSASYADNWSYMLTDMNLAEPAFSRIPYFIVFDSTGLKAGALGSTTAFSVPSQVGGRPAWSADNSAEVAKGWIIQGATSLSDLVNAINSAGIVGSTWANAHPININVSLADLTNAVNQWNTDCAAGKGDTVFGRAASAMLPISTPPFYAIAQWPAMYNTQGGPVRNAKSQVCDPYGDPIPRLYVDGECGSIVGMMYQGAYDISELVSFGRIAGSNAATEIPWTS